METIFPFILIGKEVKGQTLDQKSSEASHTSSRLAHNLYSVAPSWCVDKDVKADLTDIRENFDAALNGALLYWDQPVTVVHPENCLE